MRLTSYAQNFEDVMLWRALRSVGNGFYIDIGAQDPVVDSVSRAFYEQGWRGLHVEATPAYAQQLREDRPDETVLQAAVAEHHGTMRFHEIPGTGISTGDPDIAKSHRDRGFDVREITVPTVTLADVFQLVGDRDVHWLKIDVEGMERAVLASWADAPQRPWIVVVESTLPLSQQENHDAWESLLVERGYTPVYFDGLNRFYLSAAHPQLAAAFESGPNVFDGFVLSGTASPMYCAPLAEQHQADRQALEAKLSDIANEATARERDLTARERDLHAQLSGLLRQAYQDAESNLRLLSDRERTFAQQLDAVRQEIVTLQAHASAQERAAHERLLADASAYQQRLQHAHEQARLREQQLQGELRELTQQVVRRERQLRDETTQAVLAARQERDARVAEMEARLTDWVAREHASATALVGVRDELVRREAAWHDRLQNELAEARAYGDVASARLVERERQFSETLQQVYSRSDSERQRLQAELARGTGQVHQLQVALAGLHAFADAAPQAGSMRGRAGAVQRRQHALAQARAALLLAADQPGMVMMATVQQPQEEAAASMVDLLQLHDRAFVRAAYRAALGREADPGGLDAYTARLRAGDSRIDVLADLRRSPEGRRFPTPLAGLDELIASQPRAPRSLAAWLAGSARSRDPDLDPIRRARAIVNHVHRLRAKETVQAADPVCRSLVELLARDDADFVSSAYHSVLGRAPDRDGLVHYLGRLRGGQSRVQLLADMRYSAEGRQHNAQVDGLDAMLRACRREQRSMAGRLRALMARAQPEHDLSRALRQVELALYRAQVAPADAGLAVASSAPLVAIAPPPPPSPPPLSPPVPPETPVVTTEDAVAVAVVPIVAAPEVAVPVAAPVDPLAGVLRMDDARTLDPTDWRERVERAIAGMGNGNRLTGKLWICLSPAADGQTTECDPVTEKALAALLPVDDVKPELALLGVQSRLAGRAFDGLQALTGEVAPDDVVLFMGCADEPHPALARVLAATDAAQRQCVLFDFWFQDGARVRPVLLHGADWVHAQACDYFHSRFVVRGDALRAAVQQDGVDTVAGLARAALARGNAAVGRPIAHLPVPLLRAGDIDAARVRALQRAQLGVYRDMTVEGASADSVSAVICTKDSGYLLRPLVRQLLALPAIADVVIVSNNTSDAHALQLLSELALEPRCTVLRYDRPFNFSAQCNLGARHARGRRLLMLNDDIAAVTADWLDTMSAHLELDAKRVVGPLLLYPDQTIQHGGMYLGFNGCAGHAFRGARVPSGAPMFELVAPRQVSCLTGAVLLMERQLFDELNGFDPMMATTLQDVDFSLRALHSGATLVFEPRAVLLHMESVSVKTTLVETATQRKREAEYAWFAARWQSELARDPWFHPDLHVQDENWRMLKA